MKNIRLDVSKEELGIILTSINHGKNKIISNIELSKMVGNTIHKEDLYVLDRYTKLFNKLFKKLRK